VCLARSYWLEYAADLLLDTLGFLFAGVALVFKRTDALVGLVFSLMIFLTGALVGLESLGWIYQVPGSDCR
jgi:hypothetical protein